jgi:hypothetical protein
MRRRPNEFNYVNRYYSLNLRRGTRLKFTDPQEKFYFGKCGTVASGDGNYIMILVDGDLHPTGPFHPTSGITYDLEVPCRTK